MTYFDRSPLQSDQCVLGARDFAAAERSYAARQRRLANQLKVSDPDAAAELLLEADVCDLWAEHLLGGSSESRQELNAARSEYMAALAGERAPRGGVLILLENRTHDAVNDRQPVLA